MFPNISASPLACLFLGNVWFRYQLCRHVTFISTFIAEITKTLCKPVVMFDITKITNENPARNLYWKHDFNATRTDLKVQHRYIMHSTITVVPAYAVILTVSQTLVFENLLFPIWQSLLDAKSSVPFSVRLGILLGFADKNKINV